MRETSNRDNKITALYLRVSQEDEREGESNSIANQRDILTRYAQDNGYDNVREFADDGYSGVNFNRPGFQEMLKLTEEGKVGTIITKDLSRLGRNYIEVGNYTEFIFPRYGVRYIAVNDNVDSFFRDGNEFAPFKNLFNEWFARDTSRKIRAVFKAKGERGERVGASVPYGYRRDPDGGRACRLLVNEETAPVVREIFAMCAAGIGPTVIADTLKERQILKPSAYRFRTEGKYGSVAESGDPCGWSARTVADILDNEAYLGHTVNFKTEIVSFKDKRRRCRPPQEQGRVENTHPAIIDPETWEIVRKVRAGKRRRNASGKVNKYSGLLFCFDCGSKLYFCSGKPSGPNPQCFFCSRYRTHAGEARCSTHYIREAVLDEIVLEEINRTLYFSRTRAKEFAEYVGKKSSAQINGELSAKSAERKKALARLEDLKSLFKHLYEDNVLGRITDEQFRILSDDYTEEQKTLEERLPALDREIDRLRENVTNVQRFFDTAKRYTRIDVLTPEILRTFISKIVVHEREVRYCQTSPQQIDIWFRYIGDVSGIGEAEADTEPSPLKAAGE